MVGWERLTNLQRCVERVLADEVDGDIVETGVWRGGAMILVRALLRLRDASDRTVWVADSFAGLPAPDPVNFPSDSGDGHHTIDFLAVPLETVKLNFERFGVLDEGVRFLKGWFSETLPALSDKTWSVVRLDGDMYESTYVVALEHLYPRLSSGGYLIVDDCGALATSRQAVLDYRANHGVDEPLVKVDWTGVYWRKS